MAENRIALHFVNLSVQNDVIPADWYREKHEVNGLCIRNGNIKAIESNAFNSKAFEHLYYIEFDGLAIRHFSNGIFNGLSFLRILILRNFNLNTFKSDLLIPSQNSALEDVHKIYIIRQKSKRSPLERNHPKLLNIHSGSSFNAASSGFEVLYLNENIEQINPWIIMKKLKAILTVFLTSFLFSFSVGMKLSFSMLHSFRKISRKFKKFMQNFENDAAAMYVQDEIMPSRLRSPVRKVRKV